MKVQQIRAACLYLGITSVKHFSMVGCTGYQDKKKKNFKPFHPHQRFLLPSIERIMAGLKFGLFLVIIVLETSLLQNHICVSAGQMAFEQHRSTYKAGTAFDTSTGVSSQASSPSRRAWSGLIIS